MAEHAFRRDIIHDCPQCNVKTLEDLNIGLHRRVASLETELQHARNEIQNIHAANRALLKVIADSSNILLGDKTPTQEAFNSQSRPRSPDSDLLEWRDSTHVDSTTADNAQHNTGKPSHDYQEPPKFIHHFSKAPQSKPPTGFYEKLTLENADKIPAALNLGNDKEEEEFCEKAMDTLFLDPNDPNFENAARVPRGARVPTRIASAGFLPQIDAGTSGYVKHPHNTRNFSEPASFTPLGPIPDDLATFSNRNQGRLRRLRPVDYSDLAESRVSSAPTLVGSSGMATPSVENLHKGVKFHPFILDIDESKTDPKTANGQHGMSSKTDVPTEGGSKAESTKHTPTETKEKAPIMSPSRKPQTERRMDAVFEAVLRVCGSNATEDDRKSGEHLQGSSHGTSKPSPSGKKIGAAISGSSPETLREDTDAAIKSAPSSVQHEGKSIQISPSLRPTSAPITDFVSVNHTRDQSSRPSIAIGGSKPAVSGTTECSTSTSDKSDYVGGAEEKLEGVDDHEDRDQASKSEWVKGNLVLDY